MSRDAKKLAQEAYKKRRILERLKDRSHVTFLDDERRQEQKMFDDLGSIGSRSTSGESIS